MSENKIMRGGEIVGSYEAFPEWAMDKRKPMPHDWLTEAFSRLLIYAEGEDAVRPGLAETPQRAARAWAELTRGYQSGEPDLKTFEQEYDGVLVEKDLPFYSLCEHHLLPFHGTADFAYIPDKQVLGLSKFARLLEHYSRRLQTQENLTQQMACKLWGHLRPKGVMVVVRAEHLCMAMRGVQSMGHTTVTSVVKGAFAENAESRAEALRLMA